MSEALSKRGREPEALVFSSDVQETKRLRSEETERLLYLLQLDQTLADDEEDEECAPSEELLQRVIRSLEEEIAATCSTSCSSSNPGDNMVASDISSGHEGQTLDSDAGFDLSYLLDASDDELGLLPSPVLELKDEICVSAKETSEVSWEKPDPKILTENWHFTEDFENCQQFSLYEDAWHASQMQDHMSRDIIVQDMLFYCDFSVSCALETATVGLCETV